MAIIYPNNTIRYFYDIETDINWGRLIVHDFETSKETLGYSTPQEYWNDERVNALKERLRAGIKILNQIINRPCNTC